VLIFVTGAVCTDSA